MSTKQIVIFIFMLIFLGSALTTLGMWFHYTTEVSIKLRQIKALEEQRTFLNKEAIRRRDRVENTSDDANKRGIEKRADDIEPLIVEIDNTVFNNADARIPLWKEQLPKMESNYKAAEAEYKALYAEWTQRNIRLQSSIEQLERSKYDASQQVKQSQDDLDLEMKNLETKRKEYTVRRREMFDDIERVRMEAAVNESKVALVARDYDITSEYHSDGVVISSFPDLRKVVVDLGFEHGAQKGLIFNVYSGRHNIPILKGRIKLTEIRATSSDAIVMASMDRDKESAVTGYIPADPKQRYDPYASEDETGAPTELKIPVTKQDRANAIRLEKLRQQGLDPEQEPELAQRLDNPPVYINHGFEPIASGDWLANIEFIRIVPDREFQRSIREEIVKLRDVNLGTLTFYFTSMISPYRIDYLKRVCEQNRCKWTNELNADVDYIVTSPGTVRADLLERQLRSYADREDVSKDILNRRETLKALQAGEKYGARPMSVDDLEPFFVQRARKMELLKGRAIQPGQNRYFIAGETVQRSSRETALMLKEWGAHVSDSLDENVDYVIVGEGLNEAKFDRATNRIYYPGQEIPETARPFYDVIREMGYRLIRERELPGHFGRK